MRWIKVPAMNLKPYRCSACGSTPRDDATGDNLPAFFREGVDINWGDSLYICDTCARIISELYGAIPPEEAVELQNENESLRTELEDTLQELKEVNARVDRMLDGVKAKKEASQARTSKRKVKANA